jgi:hypothetical protein
MRRLGELHSQVAIVITSGVGSRVLDAAYRLATEQGLNVLGTISKPFRPDDLRQLLTTKGGQLPHPAVLPVVSGSAGLPTITPDLLYTALDSHQFAVWYQPKVFC